MARTNRGLSWASCAILALALSAAAAFAESEKTGGPAPAGLSFDVAPTVFFVRDGSVLKQLLSVTVENKEAATVGTLTATIGGRDLSFPLETIPAGHSTFSVAVPEVTQPVGATLTLRAGGLALTKKVTLRPQRKWTVDLFHHAHTDIGYTELQTRVAANHADYIDSAIDYCRQTDGYPDDAKFRWNIEVSWSLQQFLKTRPEARVRELVGLIKAGRVELSGLYLNQSDGFSHEELARSVDFAHEFAKANGFEVVSAMNDDVNGFSWALPQLFRQAGIKYFATGINETRSRAPLRRPCPFWWESPDGSRVLEWEGEHYLFANYELSLHEPLATSAPKVGDYLAKLEARGDFPYDMIAFNISAWTTDNCPPGRGLSDRVKEWNEKFAYPKLRLATWRDFFVPFEAKYGTGLPVYKLGWPDYWTDGVASTAFETGLNRATHSDLISGEKWSAVAAKLDKEFRFPGEQIRQAYEQATLYDEHTWGAWNSIDDPGSELARSQWTLKSMFAYVPREASRTMLRRGMEALAKLIGAGGDYEIAVFNPLSWARTDAVRVALPAGRLRDAKGKLRVIDRRTGGEAEFQVMGDALLVLAKDVPSMGYAVFSVRPGEGDAPNPKAETMETDEAGRPVLENRFYRVTVDTKTGGIASLVDKETGRELVDPACPWKLNTYIYEQPEGGRKAVDDMTKRAKFNRWSPTETTAVADMHGPVARSLVVKSAPKMCASLEQRIILYEDVKRIDLINVMDKEETFDPEAVYFAFPFKVGEGLPATPAKTEGGRQGLSAKGAVPFSVRFEISDADMAPGKEQLPGTTLDWHAIQQWAAFSGQDARVVWSPVEAPLVEFGDINTGKWQTRLDLANAWVFSYAMNNYWMTNFKASQAGRVEFRYSLTSLPPGPAAAGALEPDRVAPSRFGWEVHTPLAVAWLPAKNKGKLTAPAASFVSVDRPGVIVQALWLEADGTPVARLREIAGVAVDARITCDPLVGAASAPIPVHLGPFEIRTVRLAPGR